jgi:metal-responsive CopG/Arc/MetJ family transcriptional regulator
MGGKLRPHLTVVSGVVEKALRDDLDKIRVKYHIESRSKLIAQILRDHVRGLRLGGGLDGGS